MSDSDGIELTDAMESSWSGVMRRGKGRKKPGGGTGGPNIPGALGLVMGEKGEQLRQKQQQQRRPYQRPDHTSSYLKVVTRRTGFRQVNCCALNFSHVKVGRNNTMPSDLEINKFISSVCKLNPKEITKVAIMRNRQEVWVSFIHETLADEF